MLFLPIGSDAESKMQKLGSIIAFGLPSETIVAGNYDYSNRHNTTCYIMNISFTRIHAIDSNGHLYLQFFYFIVKNTAANWMNEVMTTCSNDIERADML